MSAEKKSNRKEWVKNVAIIFLSVMLVLTFFSNTIMNYSLPEVATAMIEPGSITAKIRGTGNLVSEDPYKITIQETRKIKSVAVKQGDVVEKDQVLFYLEDEDSAELEQAEKDLDALILAYSTSILNGQISSESYDKIQSGKVSGNNEYQSRIDAAKQKVESAQATVESLEKQIAIAQTPSSTNTDKEKELEYAENELGKAEENLAVWEKKLSSAQAQSGADLTQLTADKYAAETNFVTNRDKFNQEINDTDVRVKLRNAIVATVGVAESSLQNESVKKYEEIKNFNEYMAIVKQLYESIPATGTNTEGMAVDIIRQNLTVAIHDFTQAYEETYATDLSYQNAAKALETAISANEQLNSLQTSVNSAKNYVDECKAKVIALKNEISNNKANNTNQVTSLEVQKISALEALAKAEEELKYLLADISAELNLGNQNSIIREQREKIAKLKEEAVGATITAPIAGTVTNIYKIAGETINPNDEIAVMQPEGKGFSMSFSVTPEQAKKVTVGEQAEIQNAWYYNDITATLVGIRPDPESNGAKKLLVFDVTGDVQAGQSVSVSIGQRSANYDLLVPNSAVREDNNGKFILLVEAKNSPLGNRYIATRVDVEVLGSDDNKTAISAPLYGYEYVITTATQPVEAGKQVRLAEQ